ncbi:leucine-rich repeat receptor-like serine/threonine-protein kinase At2g14510 [Elaeis guineensis]|uniref:Leucine-rich repeat receptor-like serine/threonine-protein kinase At2g14510 n=1 Tax=Elaeis guineensis var. tenera TaxID=51953 RepID=A0A6I9SFC4_ELAGV|nr:leucine-rich repeat receptor-like serine/threonine-protein kinase At2g14510 [Elaeis guineensis]
MSSPFFLLLLFSLFVAVLSQPPQPRGFFLDCGSTVNSRIGGLQWLSDGPFVAAGVPRNLSAAGLAPTLSTLRSFPFDPSTGPRKFCYVLSVFRDARYLVRTTYYYGGVNGPGSPPVFDQIVDGTFWTMVNTTADYAAGMSSYYEGVFLAIGKTMSVCVAGNTYTESDPFISALEVILLDDSVYNSTDFKKNAMGLIARSDFGSADMIVRYPDDKFDRYWQPFSNSTNGQSSTHNISVSDFWNLPPANVLNTALVASSDKLLVFQWPPASLPNSSYYIALYFADTLPESSRIFSVFINNYAFYSDLTVTSSGLAVFATQWSLSGLTRITLSASPGSVLPPLINAGEVFHLFPLGRVTHTGDIIALEAIKKNISNPPLDWSGDPCMPRVYSWTGVTCSEGTRIRVVTLNLSSMGLSGSLSPSLARLTALSDISFANNNISGNIPDLSRLKRLEKLHLQDNQLTGRIPSSLGNIKRLSELFLQNNNLTGEVPANLLGKPGLKIELFPGNPFLSRPSSS